MSAYMKSVAVLRTAIFPASIDRYR